MVYFNRTKFSLHPCCWDTPKVSLVSPSTYKSDYNFVSIGNYIFNSHSEVGENFLRYNLERQED